MHTVYTPNVNNFVVSKTILENKKLAFICYKKSLDVIKKHNDEVRVWKNKSWLFKFFINKPFPDIYTCLHHQRILILKQKFNFYVFNEEISFI